MDNLFRRVTASSTAVTVFRMKVAGDCPSARRADGQEEASAFMPEGGGYSTVYLLEGQLEEGR